LSATSANAMLAHSLSSLFCHPPITSKTILRPLSRSAALVETVLRPEPSDFVQLANDGQFVDKSPALGDFL
jgi:hypothetical protein